MKYLNLTPHQITIRTASGDTIIPASGTVARVEMHERPCRFVVDEAGEEIPVITRAAKEVIGLPSQSDRLRERFICIVSSIVLDTLTSFDAFSVYAPDTGSTAVRNEMGHVVAVTRLVCK
jgi:hypothetical protein